MKNKKRFLLLSSLFVLIVITTFARNGISFHNLAVNESETVSAETFTEEDETVIADFSVNKENPYALETITFIDLSTGASSWKWTFEEGIPTTSAERNPSVTYNVPGKYDVTLTINEGTPDERTITKQDFIVVTQKTGETVQIGAGNGVSPWPFGYSSYRQLGTASLYKAEEIGRPSGGVINAVSWYCNNAESTARQIKIYMLETTETSLIASTWGNAISGLTPVYTSNTSWTNTSGWNTIWLDAPFNYSGTKNLKIIVWEMGTTATVKTVDTRYTLVYNTNLRWNYTDKDMSASNSASSYNERPNIQLLFNGHEAVAPKADFVTSNDRLTFLENFDNAPSATTLPFEGWTMDFITGTTVKAEIKAYQAASNSYSLIDSSNVYSLIWSANGNAVIDGRLISPVIQLPENARLEFAALYRDDYVVAGTDNCPISIYVSTDNGSTWSNDPVWTTANSPVVFKTLVWHDITVDLSAYSNQSVRLAWRQAGKYANPNIGFDNIRILASSNNKLNVLEGDYLQFADKSTGPAVLWQWMLPGSEIGSSTEQNPRVRYPDAGTYNVTLTVKNNIGEDTKTENQLVVVSPRAPMAAFSGASPQAFTRWKNYGKFIPVGATVNYSDQSLGKPTSWDWSFTGADQASSDIKNPVVTYNTEGVFNTNLSISNAMGNDEIAYNEYIKAGGTDSIWNMPVDDPGKSIYLIDGETKPSHGYLTGQNWYKFTAYSERFTNTTTGVISKVMLDLKVSNKKDEVFQVEICADRADGTPGVVLGVVDLPVADMLDNAYTVVTFPSPVAVSGPFHVVVKGFEDYSTQPTLVVIKSSVKQVAGGTVHFYDFRSNRWYAYNEQSQFGNPCISLNIVPVYTFAEFTVDTQAISFESAGGSQSVAVHSNLGWEVFCDASWVQVAKDGNTAVLIVSGENTGGYREADIYIRNGAEEKIIRVAQSGSPVLLTGQNNSTDPDIKNLTWTSEALQTGTRISWSNGKPNYGASNGTDPIVAAIRWESSDLSAYSTAKITAVDLFIPLQASYTIRVYSGNTLLCTQVLTASTAGKYNRVTLDQPVIIDLTKDLIVSCTVENYPAGTTPVVFDASTPMPYKGDLISIDGGNTFYAMSEWLPDMNSGNWCMSVILEGKRKEMYNIYRNEAKIATVTEKMYTDNSDAANSSYKVASVLNDTVEVDVSNTVVLSVYTITASAGIGGSITPAGNVKVGAGDNQAFTIIPDVGYVLSLVLVDGVDNAAAVTNKSYTFNNVTANRTIRAVFFPKTGIDTAHSENDVVIYPNPVDAGHPLMIVLPEKYTQANVDVYDSTGNLIQQYPSIKNTISAPETAGVFFLKVQLPDGSVETKRIIVR